MPQPLNLKAVGHSASGWGFLGVVLALLLTLPSTTNAATNVGKLASQLLEHEDFRVRTQAALALGATEDKAAVVPLCKGLNDKSATVRAAAAAALGKLQKGGTKCLKARLDKEPTESVRAVIGQSLKDLGGAPVELTEATRYYIAIAGVTDETGKELDDQNQLVRQAMTAAMATRTDFAFVPNDETPEESRKRLQARKDIKGFYLAPKRNTPVYADGNLTVRFEIAIFTYPTKVLKGALPVRLTEQGVSGTSTAREENLLRMAAGRAMEKFAEQIERIQ